MLKTNLILIDSSKIDLKDLINKNIITEEKIKTFNTINNEISKKEKIISYLLKKKNAPNYYLDDNKKPQSKDLFFNISHSHGKIIIAINDKYPIGVDIEEIREIDDKLIRFVCNNDEYKTIKDNKSFFQIWTSKESLFKCIGNINLKYKKIPSIPINGIKRFQDKEYYCKNITKNNLVISITIQTSDDFEIVFKEDKLF